MKKQKLKTNKSVRDRFKITRAGKVLYRPAGQSHLRRKKSGKKKRELRGWREITSPGLKRYIKRLLPYY